MLVGQLAVDELHKLNKYDPFRVRVTNTQPWKQCVFIEHKNGIIHALDANGKCDYSDEMIIKNSKSFLVDLKYNSPEDVEHILKPVRESEKDFSNKLGNDEAYRMLVMHRAEQLTAKVKVDPNFMFEISLYSLQKHFTFKEKYKKIDIYKENVGRNGSIAVVSTNGKVYVLNGVQSISVAKEKISNGEIR